ncbi:GNAT family N-acetyltransferase [Methylomonas rapida]|jgi:hypothetical protein|uniref:GNAT family N-acetyltransferase n=1 Tax=Methylomonas rapida TaxID=2963939 RepID=A0ABY7GIH6_9GAMM|nr:GNAT family N-acetyltransferase [Methylomonas rapida]WAR44406.1 GNAT family N-acetyltransferase [Methylomonas rapida]
MALKYFDGLNGFTLPLADGELIDFRPVRPTDWETIQDGMSALSAQSRYLRFFSPIAKLPDDLLRYFTEVDQHQHVAWIALVHQRMEHPGVGIARFIRSDDQPAIAEFAVTVIDSYQHRGIGRVLMAVLHLMAGLEGVEILRGYVLPENDVMLNWLGELGAVGKYDNGVYRMDLAVNGDEVSSMTQGVLQKIRAFEDTVSAEAPQNPD